MVHFTIINWYNWIGVCIQSIFRDIFNWKIWKVNLKITIINGMIIKSPRDSWNHRTGFGRRVSVFEVSWWSLAVKLTWRLIYFFIMKGFGPIHLYSNNWWEEFRATDDAGIRIVSNPSTEFGNTLIYNADRCNNYLERCCILFGGRRRTKMMRAPTWSDKYSWVSNNL